MAVDSADNLYVSEYGNNRLQKFTSNGEFVWKIGGIYTGTADGQFNRPEFVAVNTEDKIYVADSGNKRIQVFNTDGVFQFKFGGTQTGLTCPAHPSLNDIIGMSFGPNGDLYLATFHMWCDNLYQYGADGTYKGLIAITPTPGDALYNLYIDDAGHFFWGDSYMVNNRWIGRINEAGTEGALIRQFGVGNADGEFRDPTEMAQDSAGNLFVIDYGNSRLQKFNQAGDHLLTFQDYGSGTSQLNRPSDIVVDANNDIYVSDSSLATITKFDNDGNFLLAFGSNGTGEGQFRSGIRDMAVGNDGNIYAVDNHIDGNVVHVFSPTGTWLRTIGTPGTSYGQLEDVRHIAFDSQGLLYVINSATYSGYKMSVFDQDGVFVKQYGLSANVNGNYYHPNPNSLEFDK